MPRGSKRIGEGGQFRVAFKRATSKYTVCSYCRLGEYLDGKLQNEERYEETIPEDVCVKHVFYAWQLALEARERDRGRRRSMMS